MFADSVQQHKLVMLENDRGRHKVKVSNLALPLLCYTLGQLPDRLKLCVFVRKVQNGTIKPSGPLQYKQTNSTSLQYSTLRLS